MPGRGGWTANGEPVIEFTFNIYGGRKGKDKKVEGSLP